MGTKQNELFQAFLDSMPTSELEMFNKSDVQAKDARYIKWLEGELTDSTTDKKVEDTKVLLLVNKDEINEVLELMYSHLELFPLYIDKIRGKIVYQCKETNFSEIEDILEEGNVEVIITEYEELTPAQVIEEAIIEQAIEVIEQRDEGDLQDWLRDDIPHTYDEVTETIALMGYGKIIKREHVEKYIDKYYRF